MAIPAAALAAASATLASFESAPKDMWETSTGMARFNGFRARLPSRTVRSTGSVLSRGGRAN